MVTLGPSAAVDAGALAGLFRNTASSYKYVFFLGLLRCLDHGDQGRQRVPLREILVEALVLA